MKMDIEIENDAAIAILGESRLDAASAVEFRREIMAVVPDKATHVKLDLSAVTFIDSSGIGALVSLLKTIGRAGELELCGVHEAVMSAFEMTHMNRVFTFKPAIER